MTVTGFCAGVARCAYATVAGAAVGAILGGSVGFRTSPSTVSDVCDRVAEVGGAVLLTVGSMPRPQSVAAVKNDCVAYFPLSAIFWGAVTGGVAGFLYGANRELNR